MPLTVLPETLILKHEHLVRCIAHQLIRRLPTHIELDDLIQVGMLGLVEAARRYGASEIEPFATFATFATHRIRGAMLDSLRKSDWAPRSLRRRLRAIEAAYRRVEFANCAAATPPAVAEALGVPLETYHRTLRDSHLARFVSLEEPQASHSGEMLTEPVDTGPQPDEEVEQQEAIQALMEAIESLPPLQRTLLRLYYEQDYLMREIGVALALSESRVSQIHKRILKRLRIATRRNLDPQFLPEETRPRLYRFPGSPVRVRFG